MVEVGVKASPSMTPLSHDDDCAPEPVRTVWVPSQIDWSRPPSTFGSGFTVTVASNPEQPFPSV